MKGLNREWVWAIVNILLGFSVFFTSLLVMVTVIGLIQNTPVTFLQPGFFVICAVLLLPLAYIRHKLVRSQKSQNVNKRNKLRKVNKKKSPSKNCE